MDIKAPINSIMTRKVVTVKRSDTIDHAEHLMRTNHVRHLPVVEKQKLLGMLSLTDLQRMSFARAYTEDEPEVETEFMGMTDVAQVMAYHPEFVTAESSIEEVAGILAEKEFHALPVMNGERLAGIITTTDLLRYFLKGAAVKAV
jgi:CBS domain-containing protein